MRLLAIADSPLNPIVLEINARKPKKPAKNYTVSLKNNVPQYWCQCYCLNNSVFGKQRHKKKLDDNDSSLMPLILVLLLHYVVKCKSRTQTDRQTKE